MQTPLKNRILYKMGNSKDTDKLPADVKWGSFIAVTTTTLVNK